jgi:hypothetical protein
MTTSKSPSSLSDPAFTLEVAWTALTGDLAIASFAALAAVSAGGGIGLPLTSSCRKAQAGLVQFKYLHNNLEGPAVSPRYQHETLKQSGQHTQDSSGADVRFCALCIFTLFAIFTCFLTEDHTTLLICDWRWMRVRASRIAASDRVSTKGF